MAPSRGLWGTEPIPRLASDAGDTTMPNLPNDETRRYEWRGKCEGCGKRRLVALAGIFTERKLCRACDDYRRWALRTGVGRY